MQTRRHVWRDDVLSKSQREYVIHPNWDWEQFPNPEHRQTKTPAPHVRKTRRLSESEKYHETERQKKLKPGFRHIKDMEHGIQKNFGMTLNDIRMVIKRRPPIPGAISFLIELDRLTSDSLSSMNDISGNDGHILKKYKKARKLNQ